MHVANSVNGIPIRLTSERWQHSNQNYPEMAGRLYDILETVEQPETVRLGPKGERIAHRVLEERTRRIIVVYRENGEDGFIITAFLTKRTNWLTKRVAIWP